MFFTVNIAALSLEGLGVTVDGLRIAFCLIQLEPKYRDCVALSQNHTSKLAFVPQHIHHTCRLVQLLRELGEEGVLKRKPTTLQEMVRTLLSPRDILGLMC